MVPECDGQTDEQTELLCRQYLSSSLSASALSVSRISMLTCDNNWKCLHTIYGGEWRNRLKII